MKEALVFSIYVKLQATACWYAWCAAPPDADEAERDAVLEEELRGEEVVAHPGQRGHRQPGPYY